MDIGTGTKPIVITVYLLTYLENNALSPTQRKILILILRSGLPHIGS